MALSAPSFTIGIEEEYLLVDKETRDVASDPPEALFKTCQKHIKGLVAHEFLKAQIEVNTEISTDIAEARKNLSQMRSIVAEVADEYGLAPIAASTHPFSRWQEQSRTKRKRYEVIAHDLQTVVRRLMICGMHVHVGIDNDELRLDLMNQVTYFLPHLLAFSTSSPFWQGEDTGLKSYRLSVFDELPRTGLPNAFESWPEFQRHVDALVNAGLIEDASKLWWDIRPSHSFPTLEMRITDVCTRIDDAVAVAALFMCLLRMLYRLKTNNQRWRQYAPMLIAENRWRAQRYGLDEGLVDFGRGEIVPCRELLEEIIDLVREDAEALGCVKGIDHLRTILKTGTSGHRQLAAYEAAIKRGAGQNKALVAVVDLLIEETRQTDA
ncbi:MAG: carboxylate-amine ligase [Rhodospirillales bacterium]|nr:carboxylate-amine ligase [Alphaproteobacteria bacterium]MBL6947709.1 carboxylate-amine ligase [Rhodospirillales bacterium]